MHRDRYIIHFIWQNNGCHGKSFRKENNMIQTFKSFWNFIRHTKDDAEHDTVALTTARILDNLSICQEILGGR